MADFDFERFKRDFMDGVNNAADTVTSVAKEAGGDIARSKRFYTTGRDIFDSGMVTSHGGNLSECDGNALWITRRDTMLGHISPSDIVKTYLSPTDLDEKASRELVVHRAMYQAWGSRKAGESESVGSVSCAIVHVHAKYTVMRSLVEDKINPLDSEGKMLLGQSVKVLDIAQSIGSKEVASAMAQLVSCGADLGVIRGHGPFAIADSLENAYRLVSCLEYSAELLTLLESTGRKRP